MYRSFTNRVLGGVCGGIAAPLPLNAWVVRIIFILLTPVTLGGFAVLYAMLWLAVPAESLTRRTRGGAGSLLLTLLLTVAVLAGWYARLNGWTVAPSGGDLYYPVLFAVLGLIFFIRQLGRTA